MALVCVMLAAQTPAAPRVLSGVASEWRAGAARLFLSGGLGGSVKKLTVLKNWLSPKRGESNLPPATLPPTEERPATSPPRASLSTSRSSLPAPAVFLAAPAALSVTQASAAGVTLSWAPAAGAHHYRVERGETLAGAFAFVADSTPNSFQDTAVPAGTTPRAYLYRVLAVDAGGNYSAPSNLALATPVTFTNPELVARLTKVRTEHVTDLRQTVNAVRRAAGLPEVTSWADNTLAKGVTLIKAAHVQQLRDRLNEALAALGIPTPAFADPDLGATPNGAPIKKIHIEQLRERSTSGSAGATGGVSVALTSPSNNTIFGDGSNVQLSATVSGGSVAKVEFFQGSTKLGEDTSAPYGYTWTNAPEGSYSLTAVASDNSGAATTSPPVSVGVVNFTAARLDASNRIGGGGDDMVSRNFNWSLPLVGLPGRSGLDLGLTLSYNSLVWTKSGASALFDGDWGFPAPGFRLGFPFVQQKFYNAQAGKPAYLLITPAGARIELRQTSPPNTYEAVDSSYLHLTENADGGLTVRTTEGTQMSYRNIGGAFRCAEIKDRNGNFITVNHDAFGNVETVADTLGRTVTFSYDGAYLQAITQTWRRQTASGTTVAETRDWARFSYEDKIIQTNFAGLSLFGAQNGQTFRALTKVKLDDGSSFTFNYTTWGQVNQIAQYAADNRLLSYVSYNLPADAAQAQADCPRFTERRVWAAYWNGDTDGAPDASEEAAVVYSAFDFAGGESHATAPDGTRHKEFYETSGWGRGLTTKVETFSADNLTNPKKWTTLDWTQDDTGLAFTLNPRVYDTHVHDSDENYRRTRVSYTSFGLPQDVFEYDADGTTVLRRTHLSYLAASVTAGGAYANRRLIGLPEETTVYGRVAGLERLASKITVEYDLEGEFLAGAGTPPHHDGANYGAGFAVRGNACRVKRWDVDDPTNAVKAVKSETGYNTAGSTIFSRDALGHQTSISYADSDGGTTLAYPTKVTDPGGFFSTTEYNYGLGVVTRAVDPKGAAQKTLYDARGRAERVTTEAGGAYTRWEYPVSGRFVRQFSTVDTGPHGALIETSSVTVFDGGGRVRATLRKLADNYAGQRFVYDSSGRQTQQSNPIEVVVDETDFADVDGWLPTGDDDPEDGGTGWVFTVRALDWQGRPLTITNPGSPATTKEFSYGGCGCAGGQVVLTRDEVGRRQKVFYDALGRVAKTQDLTVQAKTAALSSAGDGSDVYRTSATLYNGRDQAVETLAHAGAAPPADQSKVQKTTLEYDGHGRLKSRHLPRQGVGRATTFEYKADDTLWKVTDARGAVATYGHNDRHLVTSVTYTEPVGVAPTPDVTYEYDAAGNRTRMTDGQGWASYTFDTLSRVESETRHVSALGRSYTLSYAYTLAGAVKRVTDETFGTTVGYGYDAAGRLAGVTGTGYPQQVTQFASSIKYRAWGAPKEMAYGNGFRFSATYTARMQVLRAELKGAGASGTSTVVGAENQYHEDGRLRFSTDLRPGPDRFFDRKFEYDLVGRLKEAYSGAEARGEAVDRETVPLRQTYGYSEFDNLTSRNNWHWERRYSFADAYVNDRRQTPTGQTPWEYDEDGNLLYDLKHRYKIDAAGRIVESSKDGAHITQGHDGDGQVLAHAEIITNPAATTRTYSVRSTALGGAVVAEVDEAGARRRGFVYAGGELLARVEGGEVKWEHRQPATGGRWESTAAGAAWVLTELDSLGADVGTESPYGPGIVPAEPIIFDAGSHWGSRAGSPTDPQSGCAVNGMPLPCELFRRLAANGALNSVINDPDGGAGQVEVPVSTVGGGGSTVWVDTSGDVPTYDPETMTHGVMAVRGGYFLPVGTASAVTWQPQDIADAPFSSDDAATVKQSLTLAQEIVKNGGPKCDQALASKNIPSLASMLEELAASSDIYDGRKSSASVLHNEKQITVSQFFKIRRKDIGAIVIDQQKMYLGHYFFSPPNVSWLANQRAFILMHEGVHLIGKLRDVQFSKNGKKAEGSKKLSETLIENCFPGLLGKLGGVG